MVVLGFQIYMTTRDPMSLGWLGLVEAIPALSLALLGGHYADRHDRRRIVLWAQVVMFACAMAFVWVSAKVPTGQVYWLYAIVFAAGIARGLAEPAVSAFEAQVVPPELFVRASAWQASVWQMCAIIGPAIGGFAYDLIGPAWTYAGAGALFVASWMFVIGIAPKPLPPVIEGESIVTSIRHGVRFVFADQILVGSMALDLFAVLFGGAIALLPIFATDILDVGARGLGFLNAAPSVGALSIMLWSTRHPPGRHAGRNLLLCVAGFGVSIIVFATSKSFALSMLALVFSGAFDGVSVIIRKSIMRVRSPEHMRGRIAAMGGIFIGASNEIGAFESGIAASLLGTVPSVWLGGIVTIAVVAVSAFAAPKLRRFGFGSESNNPTGQDVPI